jgi:hypothetical protein
MRVAIVAGKDDIHSKNTVEPALPRRTPACHVDFSRRSAASLQKLSRKTQPATSLLEHLCTTLPSYDQATADFNPRPRVFLPLLEDSKREKWSSPPASASPLSLLEILVRQKQPRYSTPVAHRESTPRPVKKSAATIVSQCCVRNSLPRRLAAHWRLMRVWGIERSGASHALRESGPPESADAPTRDALAFGKSGVHLNEYEMRFDRRFTRALDRFERFRATRTRHVQQTKPPEVQQ